MGGERDCKKNSVDNLWFIWGCFVDMSKSL
jgi:hypothetical protein